MRLDGAYVRMLNIIKALEGESDLGDLDPLARSVLFLVAEKQSNQEDLFVSDVIGQPGFGAAMTVFARLRELERQGWIALERDVENHRRKRVILTERGGKLVNTLSNQLRSVLGSIG
jgi:DNA-binding MarR family transcriptional regulator